MALSEREIILSRTPTRVTRPHARRRDHMIYDFVKANHHSSDPEWDGELLEEFFAEPIDIFGF